VTGRDLIRGGHLGAGRAWLVRSVCAAPGVKRLALLLMSHLEIGPFRPHEDVDWATRRQHNF